MSYIQQQPESAIEQPPQKKLCVPPTRHAPRLSSLPEKTVEHGNCDERKKFERLLDDPEGRIPQSQVANPVSQQQSDSTTSSQQQLVPVDVVGNTTGQEHMVRVLADTASSGETQLEEHRETGDDLPLTHISPTRENCPSEEERHTKKGMFSNAYSLMLPSIYIYIP